MKKILEKLKLAFVPDQQNEFKPPALRERTLLFYGVGLIILKFLVIILVFYLPKTDFFSAINTQILVSLINQERIVRNLTPLTLSQQLNQAAWLKAQDMITNNYFDHDSPSGVTPWYWFAKAGYNFIWAGENLAMHFFDTEKVFQAWMNSSSHKDNILSPNFKEMGVAVMSGQIQGRETTVSVLTFGSPKIFRDIQISPVSAEQKLADSSKAQPLAKKELTSIEKMEKPAVKEEQNKIEGGSKEETEKLVNLVQVPNLEISNQREILGVAAFNLVELAKNIFLYFSLFLIIALGINILVKIRIQHLTTIVLTLILIGVSLGLIFV